MKIKLKDSHVFENTVDGEHIRIGGEAVEVSDKVGSYLLKSFPSLLESVSPEKRLGKERTQKEE